METDASETPARRTGRKAAENAKAKASAQIQEERKRSKDVDMGDSDEDDWKPSAADKEEEKEELAAEEADDPGYDEEELKMAKKVSKLSADKSKDPFLGTETQTIPAGKALRHGDFVVLKSDSERDNVPIWRYDCHGTMQRYNPLQSQSGNYLHKSANVFSGFIQADRDKFISIAVKYVQADSTSYTVKMIKKQDGKMDQKTASPVKQAAAAPTSEDREKVIKETKNLQEAFDVHLQALISHCLDTNFLDEVINDKDVYFLDNIEKVSSMCKTKLDKAMKNTKWPQRFMKPMTTFPTMTIKDVGSKNQKCVPCDAKYTSIEVKMSGIPYNLKNLKDDASVSVTGMDVEFLVCSKCKVLVKIFHELHHHKRYLFNTCMELINKKKAEKPDVESAAILTELLANNVWLEEQFKKAQSNWADAETYVRPT